MIQPDNCFIFLHKGNRPLSNLPGTTHNSQFGQLFYQDFVRDAISSGLLFHATLVLVGTSGQRTGDPLYELLLLLLHKAKKIKEPFRRNETARCYFLSNPLMSVID